MHVSSDKKLSDRLNDLTQEAVDQAIEKHRLRGESIAISDEQGKVRVVPASEIPDLEKANLPKHPQRNHSEEKK
ncbi:hypothetical protein IQ249_19550 [Lusitaniella coriacea LEGE 07157]|uniref:Uncharacterized protein n=1 Tax=Lusitaniella coriacea LEGE 07157 TaxID=945747 RepID=A0A8J7IWJ7_9CYAN|nr:hypothetical protein [Lusitaniella coriacea]MBE9118093.1 hypothetical protein [Lusitaniella coriacea LEGE 07157]